MKVGMFATFVTLMRGGGEVYAIHLSRELAQLGHEVTMVCGRSMFSRPLKAPHDGLFNIHMRWYLFELRELSKITPAPLARVLYGVSRRFHQWAVREDFGRWDIIHVGAVETAEIALRQRRKGQPIVLTLHGPVPSVDRDLLGQLDAVVSTGQRVSEQVSGEFGIPCRVIPIGVDLFLFRPFEKNRARARLRWGRGHHVLYVGRLIPIKNLETLLMAFKTMVSALPETVLILVGDGVLRSSLEKLAARLDIRDRVRFVGALPQHELVWYYTAADLLILPSHYESFGQVVLEGLACECPVILSDGVTEIVRIFPEIPTFRRDDPYELARLMLKTLRNGQPPIPQDRLAKFTWPEVARQYNDLYVKCLQRVTR